MKAWQSVESALAGTCVPKINVNNDHSLMYLLYSMKNQPVKKQEDSKITKIGVISNVSIVPF